MACSRFLSLVLDCLPSIPPDKRWIIIAIGLIITAILDSVLGIPGVLASTTGCVMLAME